jgi:hypothetical protein
MMMLGALKSEEEARVRPKRKMLLVVRTGLFVRDTWKTPIAPPKAANTVFPAPTVSRSGLLWMMIEAEMEVSRGRWAFVSWTFD